MKIMSTLHLRGVASTIVSQESLESTSPAELTALGRMTKEIHHLRGINPVDPAEPSLSHGLGTKTFSGKNAVGSSSALFCPPKWDSLSFLSFYLFSGLDCRTSEISLRSRGSHQKSPQWLRTTRSLVLGSN